MTLHQLSLFLENRTGQLRKPVEALARADVDILAMSVADTAQFGILRLIVKDWRRAQQVLEQAGAVLNVAEVVAVEVDDRPGGLASALAAIDEAELGIEYMYAFAAGAKPGKVAIVFRFDGVDRAPAALKARGLRVLDEQELVGMRSM
jgi:hypothetical protein